MGRTRKIVLDSRSQSSIVSPTMTNADATSAAPVTLANMPVGARVALRGPDGEIVRIAIAGDFTARSFRARDAHGGLAEGRFTRTGKGLGDYAGWTASVATPVDEEAVRAMREGAAARDAARVREERVTRLTSAVARAKADLARLEAELAKAVAS